MSNFNRKKKKKVFQNQFRHTNRLKLKEKIWIEIWKLSTIAITILNEIR